MKKLITMIALLSIVLFGCSSTPEQPADASAEAKVENEAMKNYAPNPQVPDDRQLYKAGQTHLDEKGEITLKKVKNENGTYNMGPIELKITEAKVMHLKPDYSLVDYFHTLTHDEEFDFVKVFAEIKNTSDEKVNFAPVAIMETSEGEKVTWENDIYLDGLNEEIRPNETKAGNIGFIIEKSNLKDIEITTSDVFNAEGKKIEDAEKIKIDF
ncbi:hypothetical protein J7I93_04685 [Bacillus sp. ISL-47]|uniref:DUF4352 domain-containing protein n=1 Tax=Bacillus sp. ISL-47 TaxID=2819130 RepID=UPI001BE650C8|nr:DUF4352 domain-containing protein [Bacillus sp. ISL-47]MBT2687476.1 hypothetical protein [Bacillus sp. ISL-47]MBT2711175.1 hypothetical protein [Pseudomonas sp. ISL-84]